MFDEESKERLISILEDEGFDFDYEEEPKKRDDAMWCEDLHFNIQFETAQFALTVRVASSEKTISNNGVGWCADFENSNWENLSESELLSLYRDLNELNCGSSGFGICHILIKEEESRVLKTIDRTYMSCNYLSSEDAILMETYVDVFKKRLEAVAEKFCG